MSDSVFATDPGISPNGSKLMAGSAGSLVTSAGTWTFSTATGSGGYMILLNGQQAGGGSAIELEVTNQGNLYAYNNVAQWWEWINSGWTQTTLPQPITTTAATLSVEGNSPATPIGIAAPSDANYAATQLSAVVNTLPTDGTVLLSDGVTPVSVGETLSVTQLTGLEFRPTANLVNRSSVFTYTVNDPAGNAVQGNAWLNAGGNPATIWRDPPSGATPGSGVDTAPTVVQPSQTGDLVGVRLQNTGATTEASGYVTFGMVFLDAAVNPGTSLVARINGVDYAVQMDVQSTYADGSVKQAVLTLDAPTIAAGGTVDLMLAKGSAATPSPAAPSASALLASGYNLAVNFTFNNGTTTTTDSASAAAALQAALNAGTVSQWLAGPGVNEYDVQTTVDGGKLKVEFDIRAYANGTTTTDVIFDNSWMFSPGKTDLNYNVSITQGGSQVFSASNVQQYLYSMWDHQIASAGTIHPNVQYDVPYLEATGAIQAYDTSYGVSDAAIQYNYGNLNATDTGPMGTGTVDTYMPGTGGRQDIAPQPNWTAQWLLSQNPAAYAVMMADANASGGVPWHYTDESTGEAVNGQTYPNLPAPVDGAPQYSSATDPWTPDVAHMPDLNYLPYLTTGSHYQLQLLQAEADYAITSVWGYGTAVDSSGTVQTGFLSFFNQANPGTNGNQVRAAAWELRTVAEAAFLTPDNDPLKSYFTNELGTAMRGLVQQYITDDTEAGYGQLAGFVGPTVIGYNGENMAPWQEGYFVTSLAEVAGMGLPQISAEAVEMLQFMNNFISGLFINGPNGFNPLAGTAEWITVNNPSTNAPYTTWGQLFSANAQAIPINGYNGLVEFPTSLANWSTQAMGGYAEIARAALADEITYTQSPQAIQAYGLVVSQIAYSFQLDNSGAFNTGSGPTETAAYQNYPQFSVMPRLPDGVWLPASQMQIDTSNAAMVNLTGAAGQDVLLSVVGNGTATLTSKSAAGGNALLYGGSGPTTLIAGSGNDYMFGGGSGSSYIYNTSQSLQFGAQQTTTFIDGTGNDYMLGGPGPNIYSFQVNATGPRTTTIANFNTSTDRLQVAANLDGNGMNSASQLLAGATLSNGNTTLHLSPNDNITLLGINTPSDILFGNQAAPNTGQPYPNNQTPALADFSVLSTSDLMLRNLTNSNLKVDDISNNAVVGAAVLGGVGMEWQASGFGNFSGVSGQADMMMRNSLTGDLEYYDISANAVSGAGSLGNVGLEWQVSGFGDFSGTPGQTDMLMRNVLTGDFEYYDISANAILAAGPLGAVGLEWQTLGFGQFASHANESDMLMRNTTNGDLQFYNISGNQVVATGPMGNIGSEWQAQGIGDFSTNPDESDLLMRNQEGDFVIYDIGQDRVTGTFAIGNVGNDWQVVGLGNFTGTDNETDMLMRQSTTGMLEYYDIRNNVVASAGILTNLEATTHVLGVGVVNPPTF